MAYDDEIEQKITGSTYEECKENNSENTASNYTNSNYDINYYLDTICGNVIITTVCDNKSDLSVSSLLIGKVDYN